MHITLLSTILEWINDILFGYQIIIQGKPLVFQTKYNSKYNAGKFNIEKNVSVSIFSTPWIMKPTCFGVEVTEVQAGYQVKESEELLLGEHSGHLHLEHRLSVLGVTAQHVGMTTYTSKPNQLSNIYYPPEVSSMKYCCLGVFRKEYFRLVT